MGVNKTVSDYLGSSEPYSRTNDALKDEDSAAWIMTLPEDEAGRWISVLHWVRLADRLLERDRLQRPGEQSYVFSGFMDEWKKLRGGEIPVDSANATLFLELKRLWVTEKLAEEDLKIWDLYLESLERYTRPGVIIKDIEDYEKALYGLSGTFFHAFPGRPRNYRREVGVLGTLDQFYNNLRDLYEDGVRGVYYFPETTLQQFGVKREELKKQLTEPDDRFIRMMEYLSASFGSKLRSEAAAILPAEDIPSSWKLMLRNNFRRYARIEHVFRLCGYNAQKFSTEYWDHVRSDIDPAISAKFRAYRSTLNI